MLYWLFRAVRPAGTVDSAWLWLGMLLVSVYPIGTFIYKQSFERRRWADSQFNPYATSTGGDDD
jgi:hypothetical protein